MLYNEYNNDDGGDDDDVRPDHDATNNMSVSFFFV